MNQVFDAIVIGAGVAGSSAAYHLAKSRRVLLLEQFRFLHDQGSSHGASRIFRHAYEDQRYVQLAVAADELWQGLEHDLGDKLLYRTGGVDIAQQGSTALEYIESALRSCDCPGTRLSAGELKERFPVFAVADDYEALYQADAGILPATRCVAALQKAAVARGAVLLDETPVLDIAVQDDYVTVQTAEGSYEAGQLVISAGAWLGQFFGLPLKVQQQQVLYARVREPGLHLPGQMPIFIYRNDAEIYGFPLFDHPSCIKFAAHQGAPDISLAERTTELNAVWAEQTLAKAQSFLPHLTSQIVDYDLCLYTTTPDQHFIIDRHAEYSHVVVAGGFSGHGFKFGSVIGLLLKELLEGGGGHDLSLFSSSRFASASQHA